MDLHLEIINSIFKSKTWNFFKLQTSNYSIKKYWKYLIVLFKLNDFNSWEIKFSNLI